MPAKGSKLSEEHRRKISEGMLGRIVSEETRQKIGSKNSTALKGRKLSEEHRRKISVGLMGRRLSEETRQKIGSKNSTALAGRKLSRETWLKISGKNAPNWRGGVSFQEYCGAWYDREYKEDLKEEECKNPFCEGKTDRLCLHHIDYDKQNCHPSNLITLCASCNTKANYNRTWHTDFYKTLHMTE